MPITVPSKARDAISVYFRTPGEEKLENLVWFLAEENTPDFKLGSLTKDLRKLQSINSSAIEALFEKHEVNLRKSKNGKRVNSPFKRITKFLQRERSLTENLRLRNLDEGRKRILAIGRDFSEVLSRNKLTIRPITSQSEIELFSGIQRLMPLTESESIARASKMVLWLNQSLFPTIEQLQIAASRDEGIKNSDAIDMLERSILQLGDRLYFDYKRFGNPEDQFSTKNLLAISQAIAEEIALPNSVYFKVEPNSLRNPFKSHYVGIVRSIDVDVETPIYRNISIFKTEGIQGSLEKPEITSVYVVMENRHAEKSALEAERHGKAFASQLRLSYLSGSKPNVLGVMPIQSDLIWGTELLQGYRVVSPDSIRHFKLGLRSESKYASQARQTTNPENKRMAYLRAHALKESLLKIFYSECPTLSLYEEVAQTVFGVKPSEEIIRSREVPKGLKEAVVNYAVASKTNLSTVDFEKLLQELSAIRRLGRKHLTACLQKHGVNIFMSNQTQKNLRIQETDAIVLPIVRALHTPNFSPKNDHYVHSEAITRRQVDTAREIGKYLSPELLRENGTVNIYAWREFFKNNLCKSTTEHTEAAVEQMNARIKDAALKTLTKHFRLNSTFDTSTVVDWNYRSHQSAIYPTTLK